MPLDAARIARAAVVADPRWSPDGQRLGWVEGAGGRAEVVVAPADGSAPARTVTAGIGVTPTRATGGGAWCWVDARLLAVVTADGSLVLVGADGGSPRVLSSQGRASAPAATRDGTRVAFVLETDTTCDVAVVDTGGHRPQTIVSHADFAWDPAWAPDGTRLAWHEWDLRAMSWDASRIVVAGPDGASPLVVAGGPDEAVGQPRFSPDGRLLAFVSDAGGWANVWVADADGSGARPVAPEPREHAEPAWGVGQRSIAWAPDAASIAVVRNERGFGRLVVVDVASGAVTDVAKAWHHGLDWGRAGIVAIRSGARTPPTVTVHTIEPAGRVGSRPVARGAPERIEAEFVEPEPVEWTNGDGIVLTALLFRPARVGGRGGERLPPLLVDVHGGPTGSATVQWRPWVQYFVSRGWAVLAPDFRGSTGHGRAFAQLLVGGWGDLDVVDVADAIRVAGDRGWADPTRVAAAGSSAGGLTVLLVAARHPDLVRAVVSSYGVTDLAALAATTHRLESHYLDRIVGVLPDSMARYRERSPVECAGEIRVPTLVLQGDADTVVPPAQAVALVEAIRAAGGIVEYRSYPGEGHGWAGEATLLDTYERTERFLARHVLGDPGDVGDRIDR